MKWLAFIFLLSFIEPGQAQEIWNWGWNQSSTPSETLDRFEKAIRLSDAKKPLYGKLIWFYKKKISPVQARRCPYYPSCSTYTLYSMKKYGFLWVFFMGLERLYLRENTDALRKIHYLPVNMGEAEIAYAPRSELHFWQKGLANSSS